MEAKEYRTIDKESWPMEGPWNDEPDKAQWQDEATRYPCLIVRGPFGALCGYVGVSEGHPAFGVDYRDVPTPLECDDDYFPSVHGGLTFSSFCAHSAAESRGICHAPAPGEPDRVWWLGFDCVHSGDTCPSYQRQCYTEYESYKDIGYVRAEVRSLDSQLYALAKLDAKP